MTTDPDDNGTMDITAQEKTFAGFTRMVSIASIAIVLILVFLALVNA